MRRIGRVACSECRNSPSSSPPLQRPSVTHVSLLTRSAHTSFSAGHSATLLKKPRHNGSVVRWVGMGVWERDWARARPFRAEHMPMGHNRTTNRRTNAKKETTEDGPKRGWTRPPAGGRETGRAAPSTASAYPTLWGLFRKERSREREAGAVQAGERSEQASWAQICMRGYYANCSAPQYF